MKHGSIGDSVRSTALRYSVAFSATPRFQPSQAERRAAEVAASQRRATAEHPQWGRAAAAVVGHDAHSGVGGGSADAGGQSGRRGGAGEGGGAEVVRRRPGAALYLGRSTAVPRFRARRADSYTEQ